MRGSDKLVCNRPCPQVRRCKSERVTTERLRRKLCGGVDFPDVSLFGRDLGRFEQVLWDWPAPTVYIIGMLHIRHEYHSILASHPFEVAFISSFPNSEVTEVSSGQIVHIGLISLL